MIIELTWQEWIDLNDHISQMSFADGSTLKLTTLQDANGKHSLTVTKLASQVWNAGPMTWPFSSPNPAYSWPFIPPITSPQTGPGFPTIEIVEDPPAEENKIDYSKITKSVLGK